MSEPDDAMLYDLTLFVSGASELSARAITDARQLCETHVYGQYSLAIVDLRDAPAADHMIAAPTLVKNRPLPVRQLVGDLSHTVEVLLALGLPVAPDAPHARR